MLKITFSKDNQKLFISVREGSKEYVLARRGWWWCVGGGFERVAILRYKVKRKSSFQHTMAAKLASTFEIFLHFNFVYFIF